MKTPSSDGRLSTVITVVNVLIAVACARQSGGLNHAECTPPSWLTNLPQRPGWLFAVGEAGPHYFDEKGWQSAEEDARENLARTIQTRISGEYISINGTPGGRIKLEVTQETLDIALYGAQVLERYKDPSTNCYYVLVGISASNAAENIVRQARKILEEKRSQAERGKSNEEAACAITRREEEMIKKLEKRLQGEGWMMF